MSYQTLLFTSGGIVVADGTIAAACAMERAISTQSVGFLLKNADDATPIVEGALNVQALTDVTKNVVNSDLNANIKQTFATTLGMLAAVTSIGWGPAAALAADQAMSKAFENAYDGAQSWSAAQDWSPLFEAIDRIKDYWSDNPEKEPKECNDCHNGGWDFDPESGKFKIPTECSRNWGEAVTFTPRDPLALDLDNDGIETIVINPSAPILFDHNGDGDPSATGWLKGDDGWLVNDLDGDGKITSGKELLGVDTDITVGGVTRKATTGFEALRALDSHQAGDGKNLFDNRDAAFSQLRVWQDKNQNGVTDAGELSTLDALGIVSIQLQETATNVNLGGGNSVTGRAKVTRRVGSGTSESEMDSVLVTNDSAANLNLADNPFYTQLEDVPVTNTARQSPNMQGSGLVHSLREAMSLGTASSNALVSTVQAFSAATTRDAQMALLDKLITEWGATSKLVTSGSPSTVVWGTTQANPSLSATTQQRITTFAQNNPEMYRKVIVLEQFNGQMGLATLMSRWNVTLPTGVTSLLNNAYDALRGAVYGALTVQTRLKPYFDAINVSVDGTGVHFNSQALAEKLTSLAVIEPERAITDLIDLVKLSGQTLIAVEFNTLATMRSLVTQVPAGSLLSAKLESLGVLQNSVSTGTDSMDFYLGNELKNSFSGGKGDDFIDGGAGDDVLYGNDGQDIIHGGIGNDTLYGGAGNDTLDSGRGVDAVYGDAGSDTFIFSKNDGYEVVYGQRAEDTLRMNGFKADEVSFSRSSGDLAINWVSSGTMYTIVSLVHQAIDSSHTYTGVNQIIFDDKTLSADDIRKLALQGTSSNDTNLRGYASNDSIDGGQGNDSLYGENGNDTLIGGDGADRLEGGSDHDLLIGGIGNDTLYGGASNDTLDSGRGIDVVYGDAGNDTFIFSKNDGYEVVYGQRAEDTLRMNGFKADEVSFSRSSGDLAINWVSSGTMYTIVSLVHQAIDSSHTYTGVNQIIFDDKTLSADDIRKLALQGTSGNDTNLRGYASNDTINGFDGIDSLYGEGGDDKLYGGLGNDLLEGGAGADYLDGNKGNDIYLFSRGGGSDTIYDADSTVGNADILQFQPGIAHDQLWFSQSGSNLTISVIGTNDSIKIAGGAGSSTTFHIEQIKAGGKTLSDTQVANLIQAMSSMTPPAMGQTTLTDTQRAQLAPVLAANWS